MLSSALLIEKYLAARGKVFPFGSDALVIIDVVLPAMFGPDVVVSINKLLPLGMSILILIWKASIESYQGSISSPSGQYQELEHRR